MLCLSSAVYLCIIVNHLGYSSKLERTNDVTAVPVKLKSTGHNMGIIGNFKSIIGSFCGNKRIE